MVKTPEEGSGSSYVHHGVVYELCDGTSVNDKTCRFYVSLEDEEFRAKCILCRSCS